MAQTTQSAVAAARTAPAAAVEAYLSRFLDGRDMPAHLREAIKYALLAPGKRLRPILVVRCCEAVGGESHLALPPAGAIEIIHNFSLVHDDLPAMDDDDLRRGRPTLHKHTTEAMAILAGDAMTTLAFEMILDGIDVPARAALICRELATATTDMINGQVYDTLPNWDPTVPAFDRLKTIHHNKTGALIRCSCRMGAIAGGASEDQLAAITRYAQAIGLMFQVVDDILDVTQTTEQLGKAAGKDAGKGKLTYPGLIGLDASRQEVQRLQAQAHDALKGFTASADALRDLCDYMATRLK
jgi:geranylgeranyl diphosphate synthase type II